MNDRDVKIKGADAERLLNDPIFIEVFDALEVDFMERALTAPARDTEGRMRLLDSVNLLRGLKAKLKSFVNDAKMAEEREAQGDDSGWA